MKTFNFPYIALGLGLVLMLVVMKGSELDSKGVTAIPLLTLLIVSEFSFFVNVIGAYVGIKHMRSVRVKPVYKVMTLFCIVLAVRFMFFGLALWPDQGFPG
ncbi:MAG: hypothetical protein GXP22_02490 [Gammaproteobacteria bacterium]|nr:hypothetical protein [Gammaproteobacteria bacterium]